MTEAGDELRLARRSTKRKNSGEGRTALPLKRRAERERIEQRTRGGDYMGNTVETRLEDLPPLARKYVIENEGGMMLTDAGDRNVTAEEMRGLEGQLADARRERLADRAEARAERDQRIADELDQKATSLMNSDPNLDYGSAMKMAAASGEAVERDEPAGTGESAEEIVSRRTRQDPENYVTDENDAGTVGSTHDMSNDDYGRQLREAAKARGYDL